MNTNAQNAVSLLVIPVDKNNDGVLAKYRGVTYAYTDPDVKAVLQAAPYFDEVMDAGNNETEYVLTESYELSDWDSDSVSFSIGYSTEFKFLGGEASIETGYALDWTKSFERSLHEEWSQSFSAQAYNSVVVSRTPVFVYEYDIQKADGTWNDKTVMQTAIPQDLCMSSFRWMPTTSLPQSITSTWPTAQINRPATCWRRSFPLPTGWTATRATPTAITMMAGTL